MVLHRQISVCDKIDSTVNKLSCILTHVYTDEWWWSTIEGVGGGRGRYSSGTGRGCRTKAIGYSFGCGGKNWEERPAGGCSCAVKDTASRRMLCVCLCMCVCV